MVDIILLFKAFFEPWKRIKDLKGSLKDGVIYTWIGISLAVIAYFIGAILLGPQLDKIVRAWNAVLLSFAIFTCTPLPAMIFPFESLMFVTPLVNVIQASSLDTIVGTIIALFILFMITPFLLLIDSLVYYIVAKLLGGKGSFERQTFLFGAFLLPTILFLFVPLVNFVILLWWWVIAFFVLKETYKLNNLRTLAVEFIPGIVVLIMFILLLVVMNAYIIG
jgi:hypothetical protein